jgi:hypothetical protein
MRHYFRLIHQDGQRIDDRAPFDDEAAIHEHLAKCELWIEKDSDLGLAGEETRRYRFAGSIAARECIAAWGSRRSSNHGE